MKSNSDRLAGHCPGVPSPNDLKSLRTKKVPISKCRQMISKGQIHDAEIEQRRMEEDEKYVRKKKGYTMKNK